MGQMHQLIVLGNGFDLECGLKSRFSDFIDKRAKSFPSFAEHQRFKRQRKETPGLVVNPISGWKLFDEHATIWDAVLASTENDQWRDVESTIRDFFIQRTYKTDNDTRFALLLQYLRTFPNLTDKESGIPGFTYGQNDVEFCVVSGFLAQKYLTSPDSIPKIPRDSLWLTDFLLEQLHELERAFGDYLNTIYLDNYSYESNSETLLRALSEDELLPELKNNLPDTSVLDFNYTNPAIQYVQEHNIHLVNIHGTTLNPIFGIDGKDLMSKSDLVRFTKTYRLLALNNPDRNEIIHRSIDNDGVPTELIKFYGHSLGDADYSYFQAIFDGVDLYSSNTRLIFYYNAWLQDDGHECTDELAQQDMFHKVTRLMTEYGETMTNTDHGKNLMHKLLLEGRLTIERYRD